ncbi:MAG: flagellar brake domain-containing protein [Eubacterium sp.]|nr:flagellar brake domain-containing protein [Eubacterium sp.]
MVTDLLQIGNKIDICSLDKDDIRRAENGKVPILASQLEAVEDNGELIIQMPVYKGKIILLSLGSRYELIFYTRKGLYRGVCQVTDRYKEDNLFMVKVMLKSGLNKFQRREYFRLECILGMQAYELTREDALRLDGASLEQHLKDPQIIMTESSSVIVDISGGGIRFIGEKKYEEGDCLAVRTALQNENINQQLLVVVSIVTCRKAAPNMERYETRAEFLHLGSKLRETIIKYIFDEDRKIRKKDMGV